MMAIEIARPESITGSGHINNYFGGTENRSILLLNLTVLTFRQFDQKLQSAACSIFDRNSSSM